MGTKKKQKVSRFETERRLMNRWAFDVANLMMTEGDMTRSGALQQAYLLRDLLSALGRGTVQFIYEKHDGTRRTAWGTLCRGVSDAFDSYECKNDGDPRRANTEDTTYVYWDLEAQAFRSFKAENLKQICQIIYHPYLEKKY